jgi:hypothetical protein
MMKLAIGVAVALLGVSGMAWGCEDRAMLDAAAVLPANASQKPVAMACEGRSCDAVANKPAATKKAASKQAVRPATETMKPVSFEERAQ